MPDEQLKSHIDQTINQAAVNHHTARKMHFRPMSVKRRLITIATAALLFIILSGGTVYALNNYKRYHSYYIGYYINTLSEAQKEAGFELTIDPHVSNGYHMQRYRVENGSDSVFTNSTPLFTDVKSTRITIQYHKSNDPGKIYLNSQPVNDVTRISFEELADNEDNIDYLKQISMKQFEKGSYDDITYYACKCNDNTVSIIWVDDTNTVTYTLRKDKDSNMSYDDMISMAKELIEK